MVPSVFCFLGTAIELPSEEFSPPVRSLARPAFGGTPCPLGRARPSKTKYLDHAIREVYACRLDRAL